MAAGGTPIGAGGGGGGGRGGPGGGGGGGGILLYFEPCVLICNEERSQEMCPDKIGCLRLLTDQLVILNVAASQSICMCGLRVQIQAEDKLSSFLSIIRN